VPPAPAPAPAVVDDPKADEPEEIVLEPETVGDPPATVDRERPARRRAVERARDKGGRKQPADAQPATSVKQKPTPEPERVDPDDPLPR
jgi:hypothetical protein